MLWRLHHLNWRYAIGELAIVVIGVLIAFAVDEWNSNRLERIEEVEILDRLIGDLQADIDAIDFGQERIPLKQEGLLRIQSFLEARELDSADRTRLLADIVESARLGWNQFRARRTTYDEILMSGKFGLIRNTSIREQIGGYYQTESQSNDRIEERETAYADLSYQLVPRAAEFQLATDLQDDDVRRLVDDVYASELPRHVIAELNFSQFLAEQFEAWRARCIALIQTLQDYRSTIE